MMKKSKDAMVYLGGAIDLAGSTDARGIIIEALTGEVGGMFNPKTAFAGITNMDGISAEIVKINKHALTNCDIAVFVLDQKVPSIGTPMEILIAKEASIPTFVIYITDDVKFVPAYISGIVNKWAAVERHGSEDEIHEGIFEILDDYNSIKEHNIQEHYFKQF